MLHGQKGVDRILVSSQQITDGATATANLDTRGYDHATIRVNLGAEEGTDATPASISVLESDDTVVTNFATIAAAVTHDLLTAHQHRFDVDLRPRKRYLRLSVTAGTGTGSNLIFGAIATLQRAKEAPANTTDMVDDTHSTVTIV